MSERHMKQRTCARPGCGKKFRSKGERQRFCSLPCATLVRWEGYEHKATGRKHSHDTRRSVSVSQEIYDQLTGIAERTGIPRSQLVEDRLNAALDAHDARVALEAASALDSGG